MRNPFKKKALTGSSAVVDALRDRSMQPFPLLGGGNRQRIQDAYNTAKSATPAWIYTNSPAVRTVVDVVVRNFGQLDLRVYEEVSEDERQPRPDHPAALSLRYPNDQTPADSFLRSLVKEYLLFDEAYALVVPATANQITLISLPTHMVEIRGSSLFYAEGYRLWHRDGTWKDIPVENMLHWHGENPHDPRTGLSKLDTLRTVIAEDAALQQATVELANSGMTQSVYAYRPLEAPIMSNPARDGLEEDLANRMRRAHRRPFVLEEGTELRPVGVNPRDAEMMAVRRWLLERVAGAYGVPPAMVGLDDNVKDAQSQFYADVLAPLCQELERMLNQRILVREYNWTDGCFEFNLDEKLMGDDRIKTLISASGAPIFTRNESRAKVNLPPVDGGDELITPANVFVGANPKPSVDVMPIQDPNKPPQDGSARSEDNPTQIPPPKAAALIRMGVEIIETADLGMPVADYLQMKQAEAQERLPQLHPRLGADMDRQRRNVDIAMGVMATQFNRMERSLRDKQRKARKAVTVYDVDWERWSSEFTDEIQKLLEQIVEKEGTIYAFKLGGVFDISQTYNYLKAMAGGATDAFIEMIRAELDAFGFENGTLPNRGVHIESGGGSLGVKGTLWARKAAAEQSPDYEHRMKTWIPDTQRHAEFGGQTVPIGAPWPAGFAPGSAPGCRCSMSIV